MTLTTWKPKRSTTAPSSLTKEFGPLLGQILWSRGVEDSSDAEKLLSPRLDQMKSPYTMHGVLESSKVIADVIEAKGCLAIYSDYDIDGMCSLALLKSFLEFCGAKNCLSFQPDRLAEGYGVHPDAIEDLSKKGADLVITADTGISAFEAAIKAKSCNLTLVITDHHQQVGEQLPDTPYIINPNQKCDESELGYLSGTGVAFYLCVALRSELRKRGYFKKNKKFEPDLKMWLDLFALGSIADHVPLIGDNHILVRSGLELLSKTQRPGLSALIDAVFSGKTRSLNVRDVAFSIAPKLNAASRLGQAQLSTDLLCTKDLLEAEDLTSQLLELNNQRTQIQKTVFEEATLQAQTQIEAHNPPVLILNGDWHEGVLGIVAAKMVEKFQRPSIVLTRHEESGLRGSMRTLPHLSCIKILENSKDLMEQFGGHEMAAGMHFLSKNLEAFKEAAWNFTPSLEDGGQDNHSVEFEGSLPSQLEIDEIEALNNLAPWGTGNPEPLFYVDSISLKSAKILKGQHFKGKTKEGIDVIGFFKASSIQTHIDNGLDCIEALVVPEVNEFRNRRTVQLRLEHIKAP